VENQLLEFIVRAKTYVIRNNPVIAAAKVGSKEYYYEAGDYKYLLSMFGNKRMIGQEIVWYKQRPIWGMSYTSRKLTDIIPEGFDEFLTSALLGVSVEKPFRGSEIYVREKFKYMCYSVGFASYFDGKEMVLHSNKVIYELIFSGGSIE
jgi:hypothetical protein